MTTAAPRRASKCVTALASALAALLLTGACDRLNGTLGLDSKVTRVAPRPVGPERMRVTLPASGAQATLAPVARRDDVTVWQTLDGITLAFRRGLLIQTRGLGEDLMSASVANSLAMLNGDQGNDYYPHFRSGLDGESRIVFPSYQCRRTGQARRQVAIAGKPRPLRRVEETCVSPDRTFTNIYWLDPAGTIIKSRQWVSPTIEYMETERVLR